MYVGTKVSWYFGIILQDQAIFRFVVLDQRLVRLDVGQVAANRTRGELVMSRSEPVGSGGTLDV